MGNNIMTPENFSLDFGFVAVGGKESIPRMSCAPEPALMQEFPAIFLSTCFLGGCGPSWPIVINGVTWVFPINGLINTMGVPWFHWGYNLIPGSNSFFRDPPCTKTVDHGEHVTSLDTSYGFCLFFFLLQVSATNPT